MEVGFSARLSVRMPKLFTFKVEGKPAPKPRMTRRDSWKKRPAVKRYREYADKIRAAAIACKRRLRLGDDYVLTGPVEVKIIFRENSTFVEVREVEGSMPVKRGDLDNCCKSVLESLSAQRSGVESLVPILIKDDSQVIHLVAEFA